MIDHSDHDRVYAKKMAAVDAFKFDAKVADVFQDMISRSVPGYELMLNMIGLLTHRYAQPGTNCYDLGCSLGASTLQIRQHLPASCRVIGVDNSPAMVERCRARLARVQHQASSEVWLEDIQDTQIEKASVVVLNFTLQFLPDEQRQGLLQRIHDGLVEGGILFMAEKLTFKDKREDKLMTDLHLAFKKANGYSDLEISQKRTSLEEVLVPNQIETHIKRLEKAGFSATANLVRALNFVGILAIK